MNTCTRTYIYTYTYIQTCTSTRIHAHTYTYACICTRMHRYKILVTTPQRVQAISQTHIRIHMHMHAYTHIYIYTHMCTTCSECVRKCVRWCKKHTCVAYTPAHALVPKTAVPKCMQHSLQKNAHIYTCTHIYTHIYAHEHTCACMTLSTR